MSLAPSVPVEGFDFDPPRERCALLSWSAASGWSVVGAGSSSRHLELQDLAPCCSVPRPGGGRPLSVFSAVSGVSRRPLLPFRLLGRISCTRSSSPASGSCPRPCAAAICEGGASAAARATAMTTSEAVYVLAVWDVAARRWAALVRSLTGSALVVFMTSSWGWSWCSLRLSRFLGMTMT